MNSRDYVWRKLALHPPRFKARRNTTTTATTRVHECPEINRMQIDAIFRIPKKHHLLPLDLPKSVVLDDDDFDGEFVLYGPNDEENLRLRLKNERNSAGRY